jgi:hypothetical protein
VFQWQAAPLLPFSSQNLIIHQSTRISNSRSLHPTSARAHDIHLRNLGKMTSTSAAKYHNWPDAQETPSKYTAPPKGTNPVVRGAVLAAGAPLVARFDFLSEFLYKNAGFGSLRKLDELKDIKHRFDPTVVPIAAAADDTSKPFDPTDPAVPTGSLLAERKPGGLYSIRDYHEAYKAKKLTPTFVVEALLPLIRRGLSNTSVHSTAFLSTDVDKVLSAASESTKRWAEGKPLGILDGVPLAIKDEVELAGYPQSYGTRKTIRQSKETSWCVLKWQEAGAIIIGKTNMHEIGMDTTNNNFVHGTPKNPYNDQYYTGGSSGGSAYSVGAGIVPVALGTGTFFLRSGRQGTEGLTRQGLRRWREHPHPQCILRGVWAEDVALARVGVPSARHCRHNWRGGAHRGGHGQPGHCVPRNGGGGPAPLRVGGVSAAAPAGPPARKDPRRLPAVVRRG